MSSAGGDNEMEPGKIFVGALSWGTTKESLQAHFQQFGEVTDSVIMKDPETNKPRGFGFVTFADPGVVSAVLKHKEERGHIIDDKKVDPKPATVKPPRPKKVFIGGLEPTTTAQDVEEYFESQYRDQVNMGEKVVSSVELKYDRATERMKGFGFVTFNHQNVFEKSFADQFHNINGKTVEAKEATNKPPPPKSQFVPRGPMVGGGQYNGAIYHPAGQYQQRQHYQQQDYDAYGYGAGYGNYSNGQPAAAAYGAASYNYSQSAGQQPVSSYPDQSYGAAGYGTSRNDSASYGQQQYSAAGYQQQSYGNTSGNTGYGRAQSQQQQQPSYGAYPTVH